MEKIYTDNPDKPRVKWSQRQKWREKRRKPEEKVSHSAKVNNQKETMLL